MLCVGQDEGIHARECEHRRACAAYGQGHEWLLAAGSECSDWATATFEAAPRGEREGGTVWHGIALCVVQLLVGHADGEVAAKQHVLQQGGWAVCHGCGQAGVCPTSHTL
jgi:hypothetical protein